MSGNKILSKEIRKIEQQKQALRKDKKSYTPKSFTEMMEIYDKRLAESNQNLAIAVVVYFKVNENNTVRSISEEFGFSETKINKILSNFLNKTPQLV